MYEEFLEKSLNSKRQAVDDTFIAQMYVTQMEQ